MNPFDNKFPDTSHSWNAQVNDSRISLTFEEEKSQNILPISFSYPSSAHPRCEHLIKIFGTFREISAFLAMDPVIGYYGGKVRNKGNVGRDFTTTPEQITPYFGEQIGRYCYETWRKLQPNKEFIVQEFGAGKGTLALDLMRFILDQPLSGNFTYRSLEGSPYNAGIQRETLKPLGNKAEVVDGDLTKHRLDPFEGFVILNEVFDDLPRDHIYYDVVSDTVVRPFHVFIVKKGPRLAEILGDNEEAILEEKSQFLSEYCRNHVLIEKNEFLLTFADWKKLKRRAALKGEDFEIEFDEHLCRNKEFVIAWNEDNLFLRTHFTAIKRFVAAKEVSVSVSNPFVNIKPFQLNRNTSMLEIFDGTESYRQFFRGIATLQRGVVVIFDYGHSREGTIFKMFSQSTAYRLYPKPTKGKESLLQSPGRVNVTFDVNFYLLARVAEEFGFRIHHYGQETDFSHVFAPFQRTRLESLGPFKASKWLYQQAQRRVLILSKGDFIPPALETLSSPLCLSKIHETECIKLEYGEWAGTITNLHARIALEFMFNCMMRRVSPQEFVEKLNDYRPLGMDGSIMNQLMAGYRVKEKKREVVQRNCSSLATLLLKLYQGLYDGWLISFFKAKEGSTMLPNEKEFIEFPERDRYLASFKAHFIRYSNKYRALLCSVVFNSKTKLTSKL